MKFSDGNDPPASDILVKNCQNSRSVSESGIPRLPCADTIDSGSARAANTMKRRGIERKDITTPSRKRQESELCDTAADRQGCSRPNAVNEPIWRGTPVAWPAWGS